MPLTEEKEEVVDRVCQIISERFPGWFTPRWIRGEYVKRYGEISTKQISVILLDLVNDGYLQMAVSRYSEQAAIKKRFHRPSQLIQEENHAKHI